jgi:YggT family protein
VSGAACQFFNALHLVIWIYTIVLLIYAVLSWVPDLRGSWSRYVEMLVEPVLVPVRRLIPPTGGFDWAYIIVLVVLWVIDRIVLAQATAACFL